MKIKDTKVLRNAKATEVYLTTECGRVFTREARYNAEGISLSEWIELTDDLPIDGGNDA